MFYCDFISGFKVFYYLAYIFVTKLSIIMNTRISNSFHIFLAFFTFLQTSYLVAQCAGTDNATTICNKEADPSLQTFNLFSVITDATPGGTWSAESNFDSSALDEATGTLNLWQINRSGELLFTYTNPSCDASSATATINLGGYPGESSQEFGDNNACQNDTNVNLFSFLDIPDGIRGPDINGLWSTNDPSLSSRLNNEFFNFVGLPIGTYSFTYTVAAVDTCPARQALIDVELRQAPNSGNANNLSICETQDMSGLTALDLFTRLDGSQDTDGVWADINSPNTGEITSGTDSVIDVQNIFNNFGVGTYSFTYTVAPDHPICERAVTEFVLCIEEQLILDGTTTILCTGQVTLDYDNTLLANGNYNVSYTLTGNALGQVAGNSGTIAFQDGVATFDLIPNVTPTTSENLTLEITDISGNVTCEATRLCTPLITVPPGNFDFYVDPIISVSSTTGCALDDILITYANAIDEAFVPIEGTLPVSYTLNGTSFTDDVRFVDGDGTILLPVERFNMGNNTLVFALSNAFVNCEPITRTSILNLIPAPPNPIFEIVPDNQCDATNLQFSFDSPDGQSINYSTVSFDIYELGTEPEVFASRDASASLSNNTIAQGTDIDVSNTNDLSAFADGDYVFVIRSVQDDNALCRGLSEMEIADYAAQGITISLNLENQIHTFDVRMPFRIGQETPAELNQNTVSVCLLDGPITLGDLPISTRAGVNITYTDSNGQELTLDYEITQSENLTATFTSATTGCDLGTDTLAINVLTEAPVPVLEPYVFCEIVTNTVADLDVTDQNLTWFNAETGGTAYSTTDVLDATNEYWAETTLQGGCTSDRARADITITPQAETPVPLTNTFCATAAPIIDNLQVDSEEGATLIWYTSLTGSAYESTSLALSQDNEYWVTQTLVEGCESARVQVNFTLVDVVPNPSPLSNAFCIANGETPTVSDLSFQTNSVLSTGDILYFSDAEGTQALATNTNLETLRSPIYVQQTIANACFSEIVEVTFSLENRASAPELNPVTFCAQNNPTAQTLLEALQEQVNSTLLLYTDESSTQLVALNTVLETLQTPLYASQTLVEGCESVERTEVVFILETPQISLADFQREHCATSAATLNDVYLGNLTVTWFDANGTALPLTTPLENNTNYTVQLEVDGCLTAPEVITVTLIDVETPVPTNTLANLCGIEEKIIDDLLLDGTTNRFTIPENATLIWYDSADVSTRTQLENSAVLEQNVSYFAVYEVEQNGVICESTPVAITVDLTGCQAEDLTIPDAFSPNADNVNDTFELLNIAFVFPDYDIEIYNRYGRVVFKGDLGTGFWDGKTNQSGSISNDVLPTGVYFYVINFNRFNRAPLQGQVYLKR